MTDPRRVVDSPTEGREFEIIFYGLTHVLFFLFKYGFSISGQLALFMAIVVDFLVAYPLVVRGKPNDWRRGSPPWTFIIWLIPTFVVATGFYLAYWLLGSFYPW